MAPGDASVREQRTLREAQQYYMVLHLERVHHMSDSEALVEATLEALERRHLREHYPEWLVPLAAAGYIGHP